MTRSRFHRRSAVGIQPSVLVAAPSKGWKTAGELIAAAKAKPGELNFASAGIGAASHLAAEKFRVAAGIKAQHVPFKGPVEALTEVMAGRIDYYFLPLAPALALIKDGKVTALAVSSDKRAPSLAGRADHGGDRLAGGGLRVLERRVRSGEDAARYRARLYDETQKAIADPGVKERLAKLGDRAAGDVAAGVREVLQGRRDGHRQARQGGRHREAVSRGGMRRHAHGTASSRRCWRRAASWPPRAAALRRSRAANWPSKPIHAVVPIAPGTGADIMSRLMLNQLSQQLGQSIVIENKGGAGGTLGSGAVAKADPDGYTLLAHSSTHVIAPSL